MLKDGSPESGRIVSRVPETVCPPSELIATQASIKTASGAAETTVAVTAGRLGELFQVGARQKRLSAAAGLVKLANTARVQATASVGRSKAHAEWSGAMSHGCGKVSDTRGLHKDPALAS